MGGMSGGNNRASGNGSLDSVRSGSTTVTAAGGETPVDTIASPGFQERELEGPLEAGHDLWREPVDGTRATFVAVILPVFFCAGEIF